MKKLISLFFIMGLSMSSQVVMADKDDDSDDACPVGLVKNLSLDEEFGVRSSDGTTATSQTRCLEKRSKVKLLVQVNQFCRDAVHNTDCTRPYALGNIKNAIADYEVTHGMTFGEDFKVVAVVHSAGGLQLLKKIPGKVAGTMVDNPNRGALEALMEKGVEFYFCQNTVRSLKGKGLFKPFANNAMDAIVPGVKFVTAGVTAIADFQSKGWKYIQP